MIDLKGYKVKYRYNTYTTICAEPVFTHYESPNSEGMYNPTMLRVWVLNEYGHLTAIAGNYYKFEFVKDGECGEEETKADIL